MASASQDNQPTDYENIYVVSNTQVNTNSSTAQIMKKHAQCNSSSQETGTWRLINIIFFDKYSTYLCLGKHASDAVFKVVMTVIVVATFILVAVVQVSNKVWCIIGQYTLTTSLLLCTIEISVSAYTALSFLTVILLNGYISYFSRMKPLNFRHL